jgi:hypothetical protein
MNEYVRLSYNFYVVSRQQQSGAIRLKSIPSIVALYADSVYAALLALG